MSDPFPTPLVYVNAEGFGPTTLPERFQHVPFVTFSKWEALGKVANFGDFQLGKRDMRQNNNYSKFDDKRHLFGGNAPQTVTSIQDEDGEGDFELVDTSRFEAMKSRGPKLNLRRNQNNQRGGRGRRGGPMQSMSAIRGEAPDANQPVLKGKQAKYLLQGTRRGKQWNKRGGQMGGRRRDFNDREMMKEASVKIRSNWELQDSIDMPTFTKLGYTPPQATDLLMCGELHRFDETYDKITLRSTKPLKMTTDIAFVYSGTLEDPVLQKFIAEKKGTVYATDEILAYLMTITRSTKTWDLIFTKVGDNLFIDKRDDAELELLTVNESFNDRVSEKDEARLKTSYNLPDKLSVEATAINQSFLVQTIKKEDGVKQAAPNPFEEEDEPPHQPITYLYRSWQLGTHKLVARTEVHASSAVKSATGQPDKRLNVYALNEFDSKLSGNVDWKQKLDNQIGAVMANEFKNNAGKVARWTAQSLLSGVDSIKLGFVSRVATTDPSKHVILNVNTVKPRDLAMHIALTEKNMWGGLKYIIDIVMAKESGKYLLIRDPNKPLVKLYKVPMNTFEESDDEGQDEEVVEEEEDGEVFRQPEQDEDEDEDDI